MSVPQLGNIKITNSSQLVEFLESGCKPSEKWRIGTEHEKFGYVKKTLLPLPYEGTCSIKAILSGLKEKFEWEPIYEANNLIGLSKNGANISLEPGGQLELSGGALETIHDTCDEVNSHLKEVRSIAGKIGAGFIGLGATPDWLHKQMPTMPKGRYNLMTKYMDRVGTLGKDMMYRTCCIQVNLDYSSESDMIKKFRVSLALQPIATALFANSPFFEGSNKGFKSWRSRIWRDLDSSRTGMLPFVFEDGMSFERYVEYALDVPMYFVFRNGIYIDALGQSFRDFLKGKLPALPNELPRISDWGDHLTTIFPEVRLKKFLEMRGADGGAWNRICALPALWVGILYDKESLNAAWDLCKRWTREDRENLLRVAFRQGLQGHSGEISIKKVAHEILLISHAGLQRRAKKSTDSLLMDESHFLNVLFETVSKNKSPADELLQKYHGNWNQDLKKIYDEFSY